MQFYHSVTHTSKPLPKAFQVWLFVWDTKKELYDYWYPTRYVILTISFLQPFLLPEDKLLTCYGPTIPQAIVFVVRWCWYKLDRKVSTSVSHLHLFSWRMIHVEHGAVIKHWRPGKGCKDASRKWTEQIMLNFNNQSPPVVYWDFCRFNFNF